MAYFSNSVFDKKKSRYFQKIDHDIYYYKIVQPARKVWNFWNQQRGSLRSFGLYETNFLTINQKYPLFCFVFYGKKPKTFRNIEGAAV